MTLALLSWQETSPGLEFLSTLAELSSGLQIHSRVNVGLPMGQSAWRETELCPQSPLCGLCPRMGRGWVYMGLGPLQSEGARNQGVELAIYSWRAQKVDGLSGGTGLRPSSGEVGLGFLALL